MKNYFLLIPLLLFSACMSDKASVQQNEDKKLFLIAHDDNSDNEYKNNSSYFLKALEKVTIKNITANNGECVLFMHLTPYESENSYYLAQNTPAFQKEVKKINEELEESEFILFEKRDIKMDKDDIVELNLEDNCNNIKQLSVTTNKGSQSFE